MLLPAITGSGVSVFVIARSACVLTVVVAVAVLGSVGSGVTLVTLAVFVMMVPAAVAGFTRTTSWKLAVLFGAAAGRLAMLLVTLPVPPTAGVAFVQPGGPVNETNVVLVG